MLDRIAQFYQKTISQTRELLGGKLDPPPVENSQGLYLQYQAYKKIEQPPESRLDQVKDWIQEHGKEVKKYTEELLKTIDTAQFLEGAQEILGGTLLSYGGVLLGAASCTAGVAGGLILALPSGATSSLGGSALCSGGLTVAAGALGVGTLMMHQGVGKIVASNKKTQADQTASQTPITETERPAKISKSESPIWKDLKPWRGKIKTNGLPGRNREYYVWDYMHGEIEVYDSLGKHEGAMDAISGSLIKKARLERKITYK